MSRNLILGLALLASGTAASAQDAPAPAAAAQPELVVAAPAAPADQPGAIVVAKDTMVRLMVLNEVNTNSAKPGDRFVLRVDENVIVHGATVIPVGAKAYGEVTRVKSNGGVGKAGSVGAKLLYVEIGEDRIPIAGEDASKGRKEGGGVVLASAIWGPFGLLMKGGPGKLKAGHIFNGYIPTDLIFDPAAGRFVLPGAKVEAAAVAP
ncbi:MAG TPA: hypothetical protein VE053_09420 [Allosphingosinicella sp.]|nr:hypothetical protein [Allosphingosinicella sp.]